MKYVRFPFKRMFVLVGLFLLSYSGSLGDSGVPCATWGMPQAFAGDLRVIQTEPQNKAVGVDPFLTEVVIVFSGPVKMNSWSFVRTDQGEFPALDGNPFFTDNRTCVLPVLLEPDTTYGIGINSASRRGFKSASDERITAEPYVLNFRTAGTEPAPLSRQEAPQPAIENAGKDGVRTGKISQGEPAGILPTIVFNRVSEANEKAFSLLIPKGWQRGGGIFRVDPTAAGGAGNSIAAKLDFSVKKDPAGSVMMRWLPDILYFDARMSPAGQMGLFPPGSNYNGMTVYPVMSAQEFLNRIVIPYLHSQATGVEILERRNLPGLARKYHERVSAAMPRTTFTYDAGIITLSYGQGGLRYKERILTVVENWGALGAGMWGNKETLLFRAPLREFEKWEPIVSLVQQSVIIDPQWIAGEIRGQMQRSQTMSNVMRDIQRIGREIAEHRRITNAEIHNDMFLTLTDQEEYVNPFTKKVESGSNQWAYRWVNESGDVIYTNDETYDPRVDVNLNRSDYLRTPIRKRGPQ